MRNYYNLTPEEQMAVIESTADPTVIIGEWHECADGDYSRAAWVDLAVGDVVVEGAQIYTPRDRTDYITIRRGTNSHSRNVGSDSWVSGNMLDEVLKFLASRWLETVIARRRKRAVAESAELRAAETEEEQFGDAYRRVCERAEEIRRRIRSSVPEIDPSDFVARIRVA